MDLSNAETRHIKRDGMEYLEFTAFDNYRDKLTVAFAIRGERDLSYFGSAAAENYQRLSAELGIEHEKIVQITEQVHSDRSEIIAEACAPTQIDGLITRERGLTLVTRVADCIAVLIYDPAKNAIANIHSGWRGTLKRIVPKAVEKMRAELGSDPQDLICVLCPSIGVDHFAVDRDVRELFVAEFGEKYMYDLDDKTYIDAPRHLTDSLMQIGVKLQNVHDCGICTVCNKDLLHSYRANRQTEQSYRNAAMICLK